MVNRFPLNTQQGKTIFIQNAGRIECATSPIHRLMSIKAIIGFGVYK